MDHRRQDADSPSPPPPLSPSPPLRSRHHSSTCFSSCFGGGAVDEEGHSLVSPSSWFRSKTSELPEIQGKCRSLISNIGKRRHHSADFRYDPLSYALNFDDGSSDDSPVSSANELRYRGFSARLPASPPSPFSVNSSQIGR